MAKKKKPASKKKSGGTKKPATKAKKSGAAAGLAPKPVKTGRGATPTELAAAVMKRINNNQWEVDYSIWSPRYVSIEGAGVSMAWHGKKAVDAKNAQWYAEHEMIGGSAEGPYVGATGFTIKFNLEVKKRATGENLSMTEVGVYTVENGRIVREEFMYGMF